MEEMKVLRLGRERKALVISRKHTAISILRAYKISQLPFTEVMPEPVDFCAFPEIQAILELPNDVDVDDSSFAEVVPLLSAVIGRWRAQIIQKFAARVRQAHEDEQTYGKQNQDLAEIGTLEPNNQSQDPSVEDHAGGTAEVEYDPIEKMKLAITVFKCRKCGEKYRNWPYRLGSIGLACHKPPAIADMTYPLFYPQVLGHRCLTRLETLDPAEYYQSDLSLGLEIDTSRYGNWDALCVRQNWDCRCLAVDAKAGERVAEIVATCGLDPATATAQDMDTLDARVGCPNCATVERSEPNVARLTCLGWREAVSPFANNTLQDDFLKERNQLCHQSTVHHDQEIDWIKLGPGPLALALEFEKELADSSEQDPDNGMLDPPSGLVVWMCAHCLDRPAQTAPRELDAIKDHVCHRYVLFALQSKIYG